MEPESSSPYSQVPTKWNLLFWIPKESVTAHSTTQNTDAFSPLPHEDLSKINNTPLFCAKKKKNIITGKEMRAVQIDSAIVRVRKTRNV